MVPSRSHSPHRNPGRRRFALASAILSVVLSAVAGIAQEPPASIPREQLLQDVRRLTEVLETSHPDPHLAGGGRVAFYRRIHQAMHAIPEAGLTVQDFYRLLLPLVAMVGDGHTALAPPGGHTEGPGLPFGFGVVEQTVYVAQVHDEADRRLLGARLGALAGVPFAELLARQKRLTGFDNEFQLLTHLCRFLTTRAGLDLLVPEWSATPDGRKDRIAVGLVLPSDDLHTEVTSLSGQTPLGPPIEPPSSVALPAMERTEFAFTFLDPGRSTALLRIDGMFAFRENLEFFTAMGAAWAEPQAARIYRTYHGKPAPEDPAAAIAGLPSATEVFRELAVAMKEAGTRTLIVDLRRNGGGNSLMANILLYFLHGAEAAAEIHTAATVAKYSDLYFDTYTQQSMDTLNRARVVPLGRHDYDFSRDPTAATGPPIPADRDADSLAYFANTPTFLAEFRSRRHAGLFRPAEIVVLSSPWTYSSGFTLMHRLHELGAAIAGVPSGQAANCYGDTLGFRLPNSGLRGSVSFKQVIGFPDDPERGRVLRPQLELTYDQLRAHRFDPNTVIHLVQ